jgi:CcmD family protein
MESYGKIFVVVTVLSVILIGVFVYLFMIDRKVRKLEKETELKSTKKEK